ncbi:DUF1697 domain-containing protein [Candidatus Microgenomates bacterium]|nr:MAG: DUF1697 domain-containing protein [Candidatus Microgenomates bacterium]
MKYLVLLRGINVGGKNNVKMGVLKTALEEIGFENVVTFIQSGNIILESHVSKATITKKIEQMLPQQFKLDSELIKAFVYSTREFEDIIRKAPKDFGRELDKYYYDFIFLKNNSQDALTEFDPHPEVDSIWAGPFVLYFRRLTAKRTKSRLGKIAGKTLYKNLTIRSFSTTSKLLALLSDAQKKEGK